jgi:hypothetical protein
VVDVKPAMNWKARILEVKDLPAGALVGYGGMHRCERPSKMAVLAVGYADGLHHRLSNKGKVIANGNLAPILGAISMDLTSIDITDCPPLAPGDPVTLARRGRQRLARRAADRPHGRHHQLQHPVRHRTARETRVLLMAKLNEGPVMVMTVMPNGPMAMGANLTQWFLYSLVVSLFAAYVAGRALGPDAHYLAVFRFAGVTAFCSYALGLWPMSIWYKRSWWVSLKSTIDGLVYGLLTAGVFGWLWPR